jgi:hypothetical protein
VDISRTQVEVIAVMVMVVLAVPLCVVVVVMMFAMAIAQQPGADQIDPRPSAASGIASAKAICTG